MTLSEAEHELLRRYLWPREEVMLAIKQSQVHKAFNPTIIAVTSERVIVVTRILTPPRTDIDSLPYKDILAVRFEEGTIFSSVFFRLAGSLPKDTHLLSPGEEPEGELEGLERDDARRVAELVEKRIDLIEGGGSRE